MIDSRLDSQNLKEFLVAPLHIYHVEAGKKYRFRLINSGFNVCPFQFQIESHNFSVIATELSYVEPLIADTLQFLSGERFDIVLNANQEPRDYWIRVREMEPCWKNIEVFAILRYHKGPVRSQRTSEFTRRTMPTFEEVYETRVVS